MKKIIIIGESHTRHFSFRKNIIPLFADNGKRYNLDNVEYINEKINMVAKKIDFDHLSFLYIGEPNCRISLVGHWTPHWDEIHKGHKIDPTPDKKYISKCIDEYKKVDLTNIDYILTPTSAYDATIPTLKLFNETLKEKFGDLVIDIFKYTHDEKFCVLNEYKSKNWEKDPIHLNSKISDKFVNELYIRNIIDNKENYAPEMKEIFDTHFVRDKEGIEKSRFGTYKIL
jgi:hypothetical protein